MNVHIIRNGSVSDNLYTGVFEYLKQISGPYNFIIQDEPIEIDIQDEIKRLHNSEPGFHIASKVEFYKSEKVEVLSNRRVQIEQYSWEDLLSPCSKYRNKNNVPDKDIVIVLSKKGNHHNWFFGFDKSGIKNYFVHAELWDYYTESDFRYPIAYMTASVLLSQSLFSGPKELLEGYHKDNRGCFMDFCEKKEDVMIKMRTADICMDCQKRIEEYQIPYNQLKYTFDLFENIRKQILLKERYKILKPSSSILVKGRLHHIYIPEQGMLKINLTPLERAVYLLFLNHLEGIALSKIVEHKSELSEIVMKISKNDDLEVIEKGIHNLCITNSNSLSEKLARIRLKFNQALGEELANDFIVSGPNGEPKKINLKSDQIKYED
jgi:hypothetical protein